MRLEIIRMSVYSILSLLLVSFLWQKVWLCKTKDIYVYLSVSLLNTYHFVVHILCYIVDYQQPPVELRGPDMVKEEWESNQRRLENQLRQKGEELRILEEERAKLRSTYI